MTWYLAAFMIDSNQEAADHPACKMHHCSWCINCVGLCWRYAIYWGPFLLLLLFLIKYYYYCVRGRKWCTARWQWAEPYWRWCRTTDTWALWWDDMFSNITNRCYLVKICCNIAVVVVVLVVVVVSVYCASGRVCLVSYERWEFVYFRPFCVRLCQLSSPEPGIDLCPSYGTLITSGQPYYGQSTTV